MAASFDTSGRKVGVVSPTNLVANPYFTDNSIWTTTIHSGITGGRMLIIAQSTYATLASQDIGIAVGNTYKVEFDITEYTSGEIRVLLGSIDEYNANGITYSSAAHVSENITFSNVNAPLRITFYSWGVLPVLSIDNVSVTLVS